MKKVLLIIIVSIVLLTGCSGGDSETKLVELTNARVTTAPYVTLDNEVAILEFKDDKDKLFVLMEFNPTDNLKTVIKNLSIGQKMHLRFEPLSNVNFFLGRKHNPYYHIIKQIIIIPSGEKYDF